MTTADLPANLAIPITEEPQVPQRVEDSPGIRLRAIRFHTPWRGRINRPLQIRKSSTEPLPHPEWQAGMVDPRESPVAYRTRLPGGRDPNRVVIEATFDYPGDRYMDVEIRALGDDVLGSVCPRQVRIGGTETEPVFHKFDLEHVQLGAQPVGVSPFTWRWQYRLPQGSWRELAVTNHVVYAVLGMPTLPWKQFPTEPGVVPDEAELPWANVLDRACRWAARTSSASEAAARITGEVFQLGRAPHGPILSYQGSFPTFCEGEFYLEDARQFFESVFHAETFMQRIASGPFPAKVCCTDCATIVATFGNILGCDLEGVQIRARFALQTNAINLIGNAPDTWEGVRFIKHEVTWGGPHSSAGEVWDACLMVDADDNPTLSGAFPDAHAPSLAAPLRFGDATETGTYLWRFVEPASRGAMRILAARRRGIVPRNYPIEPGDVGMDVFPEGFRAPAEWEQPRKAPFNVDFLQPRELMEGWHRPDAPIVERRPWALISQASWSGGEATAIATSFELASPKAARDVLWQMLQQIGDPKLTRELHLGFGDAAFGDVNTFLLFVAGNVIFQIQGGNLAGGSLQALASGLDAALVGEPHAPLLPTLRIERLDPPSTIARVGDEIPLSVGPPDLVRNRPLRFFADPGQVKVRDGLLSVTVPEAGDQIVRVFAFPPEGEPLTGALKFTAEPAGAIPS